jgi:hypothetical protein
MPQAYNWSWVQAQCAQTVEVWRDCAGPLAFTAPHYSLKEHQHREKAYDEGLSTIERQVRKAPRARTGRGVIQEQTIAAFGGWPRSR